MRPKGVCMHSGLFVILYLLSRRILARRAMAGADHFSALKPVVNDVIAPDPRDG